MKLKYEDLLFALAENGEIIASNNILIIKSLYDSLRVKISSSLNPYQVKMEFLVNGTDFKKVTVIDALYIKNFLDYSYLQMERQSNSNLIKNYGLDSYNKLKKEALSILSGEQNHKIESDEILDYDCFELSIREYDLISTLEFNKQNINYLQPLSISFNTYLEPLNEKDKKSVSSIVLISVSDLDKYELLKFSSPNENEFLFDLIKDETIQSPILKCINIEHQLEEKKDNKVKRKI